MYIYICTFSLCVAFTPSFPPKEERGCCSFFFF